MSAGAFEDDGDAVIEMDLLPPRWADISDEVTDYLTDIAAKSQKLEKLHQKHVLPGFDDEEVKQNEEGEIESLTQDITRGFHDCQKAIQRVEQMVRESKQQQGISRGEETMARNIQISLAGRVQEASAGFRKKQSAYLKSMSFPPILTSTILISTELRGLSGMNPALDRSSTPLYNTYANSPSLQESDADASYSQNAIQQTAQKQLTSNDTAIMQREQEIMGIAQGIIELADIFKELQTMIIDQGTMLDRIDYNVERMATDVKGADKELIVASGYQKKGTKRRLILLLILLIVGMVILLVVKPKRHGGAVSPPSLPDPEPEADVPPP